MSALPARSFGSLGVAMVTPFTPEGEIDIEAAQALAVTLVEDGADMILLAGTTGEAPTTHLPEKQTLLREVRDALAGRAMLVAGAGSNDTAHAVRIGVGSQEAGAQGLLINAPYYNRPSQEGVRRHIMSVVEATDLPVMIYDIPGRTGVRITDGTLARLAEHERVLAVKDATGDVEQGFRRMEATGLEYYSGDDGLNFAWLTHGASGVISVVAHADAHSWREMITEVDAGDLVAARAVARRIRPLVSTIMGGGQGAVMAKEALLLQGRIPCAALRLPLVRAQADDVAALRGVLEDVGLL
ncbi:4-hydroxy-tetrahydrodipicolinate synthase [Actinomyces sp. oral taxon 448]|jgi:hypothetical protein|uniref:4-hydroxy-tetrahydrodipicolinate synthase n=1 Tax=Actinomyces sp. oral taxon 448 TaxID=712124 RepID=UPI0002189087|nr:4-hydroxy-tetrahydrodipicolinate synthase [Actinomyces sp. oral taxon 448]EGQ73966.1 dihydrodipicolinate synthase [Actinomyces sp. oral taxon 448 str. F0400]